jgi:hypothetical protein
MYPIAAKTAVLVVQSCRRVSLSKLAERFPQPIKVASRLRSLQRLLSLKIFSASKLWFPIVRELLKKEKEKRKGRRKKKIIPRRISAIAEVFNVSLMSKKRG